MRSLVIFALTLAWAIAADLKTVYEWKWIDYQWKSECDKQLAIDNGQYDHRKVIPYDAQAYKDGRVFITTPRVKYTNPGSVSIISNASGPGGSLLRPYPSWEWHAEGNCSGITSALRVAIDKCDRLWIVDSGKIGHERKCPAQILAFSLKTNKLLLRHRIPKGVANDGLLAISDVETKGAHCEKTWVYIADLESYGFIVFDGSKSWRVDSECLRGDPGYSGIHGAHDNDRLNIGTIGLAKLSEKFVINGGLLMWSFTSGRACMISIPEAHNSDRFQNNITWYYANFQLRSQVAAGVFSKTGVAFSGCATENNLVCLWMRNKFLLENVVELCQDREYLDFITSLKTFDDKCGREWLGILTNSLSDWKGGKMDCSKVNFRMLTAEIATLIDCTACEPTTENFDPVSLEELGLKRMPQHHHCG